jgi:tRNA pseudouridine55 synthase
LNTILNIDKPQGMTSHDVVARVRRICSERSVGHLGTLDPMATGVLPLVLGKMTRIAQFFGDAEKEYEGTIRFGFATNTYDAEGEPAGPEQAIQVSLQELNQLSHVLRGPIQQVPPPFSAKKINGVPAYKLARKDAAPELKAVAVQVHEFELFNLNQNSVEFRCRVSAGTYIRSLAHELGRLAGCGAHLSRLRRTRSGEFYVADALTLEKLEAKLRDGEPIGMHPRAVLSQLPSVFADEMAMARIRHGNATNLLEMSDAKLVKVFNRESELVAIASRIAGTLFQPKVVLV